MSDRTPHLDAREAFGDLAPEFASLTDEVLFDRVWARPGLTDRDRSLVTIASLITGGNVEQLAYHVPLGMRNGLTAEEVVEAITHLAFYAGWPKAVSALGVTRALLESD